MNKRKNSSINIILGNAFSLLALSLKFKYKTQILEVIYESEWINSVRLIIIKILKNKKIYI